MGNKRSVVAADSITACWE